MPNPLLNRYRCPHGASISDLCIACLKEDRAEIERLRAALRTIKGRDSHIDATPRGERKVILGDFAKIADAALTHPNTL